MTKKGKITAKKKGTTTITVTSKANKKKTAKIKVTVGTPVSGVSLEKDSYSVNLGETLTLIATIKNAKSASNKKLHWSSSDQTVLTVADGIITPVAVGKVEVTVMATDGSGKSAKCTVEVMEQDNPDNPDSPTNSIASITLDKKELSLIVGTSETITATVNPATAEGKIIWTSSNDKVAAVNNGKVTAVAPGAAIIKAVSAENNNIYAESVVHVEKNYVKSINVLDEYTIYFELASPEVIKASDIFIKSLDFTYRIKEIKTVNNCEYYICLRDELGYYIASVSIRNIANGLYAWYDFDNSNNLADEYIFYCKVGDWVGNKEYFVNPYNNPQISFENLPKGITASIYIENGMVVFNGFLEETGVTETKMIMKDGEGHYIVNIYRWIVGSTDEISAYANDGEGLIYLVGDTVEDTNARTNIVLNYSGASLSKKITASCDNLDSSRIKIDYGNYKSTVHINPDKPGDYTVKLTITDNNNTSIKQEVTAVYHVKKAVKVTGQIKDSEGNVIPMSKISYLQVGFMKQNNKWGNRFQYIDQDRYYDQDRGEYVDSDSYVIYVEPGEYVVRLRETSSSDYYRVKIAEDCVRDIQMTAMHKISFTTDSQELTINDISALNYSTDTTYNIAAKLIDGCGYFIEGDYFLTSTVTKDGKDYRYTLTLSVDANTKSAVLHVEEK